ncbi:MAG: hypothetical protein H6727_11320 [Myxococcales bacterium]|nr:hypothetical protein [Myxococcales bacterium]
MAKKPESEVPNLPKNWPWILGWVGGLLLLHIMVPLMYYINTSPTARSDERFRWRMFSTVRMRRCSIEAFERKALPQGTVDTETLRLSQIVQEAWIDLMRRGRPQVMMGFMRKRCTLRNRVSVELRQYCRSAEGKPLFVLENVLDCKTNKKKTTYRSLRTSS